MRLLIKQILSVLIMSVLSCSCINDAYDGLSGSGGKAVIRLTLSSDAMQTRSSAAITNEGTIHTVCVGIFDNSGNTLTIHEYTYNSGKTEDIATTPAGTEMFIAANVPSGLFAGKKTKTDFLSAVQELGYTTSANGLTKGNSTTVNSQEQSSLPMYADVTGLSLSGTEVTTKEISLTRVVSRVTLSGIKVNFGNVAEFAGATFVPEEIFMYDANDRYAWNGTVSSSVTDLSGESTSGTAATGLSAISSPAAGYLSSGKLTYTGEAGTKTYLASTDDPYYFYVFPHGNTSPTKLIIKGFFYPKGKTETEGEVMYYPITVNHSQRGTTISVTGGSTYSDGAVYPDESTIKANTVYSLGVTITGRGVSNVADELVPSSVAVNMDVSSWNTASASTDFKPALSIGNFLYSDGSYGAYNSSKTAIAVIFSTTTSITDRAHGWTHGYAMALTNASTNALWANVGDTVDTAIPNTSGVDSLENNKDGYTESQIIGKDTNYCAIYSALTYSVPYPSCTSGWYLPSTGQWYDICTKLGGISGPTSYTTARLHWSCYDYGVVNDSTNYSAVCKTNINEYLKILEIHSYAVDTLSSKSEYFWSSSERSKDGAYVIGFSYNYAGGPMYIKTLGKPSYFKAKPVIAF